MSIEKVTLENAAEQLKSKIRTAFVELLPEEQWKEMVTAELKRFTETTSRYDTYASKHIEQPSEFGKLCKEVFSEHLKAEIKALLVSKEWQGQWGNTGREQISDAIGAWLTANAKPLIESTVQALAGQAAQQLVSGMRHL